MSELRGCTDGNCIIRKPEGMHTNGGCGCERELRHALGLQDSRRFIHALRERQREVAALREDAERYRWLRKENERHCDEEQPCVMLHAQNDWGNWVWLAIDDGEHMDATIDKARSEPHAQGGAQATEGTNQRTSRE